MKLKGARVGSVAPAFLKQLSGMPDKAIYKLVSLGVIKCSIFHSHKIFSLLNVPLGSVDTKGNYEGSSKTGFKKCNSLADAIRLSSSVYLEKYHV
jgi:hypothetical protein